MHAYTGGQEQGVDKHKTSVLKLKRNPVGHEITGEIDQKKA